MSILSNILKWAYSLVEGGMYLSQIFTREIWQGFSIINLLTWSALFIFLGVAVVKWLIQ